MARTPTWKELWLDAANLNKIQRQCYQSVAQLIDSLPELDQKMEYLRCHNKQQSNRVVQMDVDVEPKQLNGLDLIDKSFSAYDLHELGSLQPAEHSYHLSHYQLPEYFHQIQRTEQKEELVYVEILDRPQKMPKIQEIPQEERNHKFEMHHQAEKQQPRKPLRRNRKQSQNFQSHQQGEISHASSWLEDLERTKRLSLQMPLSEYLKSNRPEMVMRADARTKYLKELARRRRLDAITRTRNAFEQMCLQSRSSSDHSQPRSRLPRSQSQTYTVKHKLSEHEMKRLTAKKYKNLPEVKNRRKEELSKHMKVQNYKNKLEYGRELLKNRRERGVINYGITSSIA